MGVFSSRDDVSRENIWPFLQENSLGGAEVCLSDAYGRNLVERSERWIGKACSDASLSSLM